MHYTVNNFQACDNTKIVKLYCSMLLLAVVNACCVWLSCMLYALITQGQKQVMSAKHNTAKHSRWTDSALDMYMQHKFISYALHTVKPTQLIVHV
jgi:hypothetical protein